MREYLERLVKTENDKRATAYRLAVAGWLNDQAQQRANGGDPLPYPAPPFRQEVIELEGEAVIVESSNRVSGYACNSLFKWGPDGNIVPPRQA